MITHRKFRYEFGFNVRDEDDFTEIKVVESKTPGSKYKTLYVLDYVPGTDLSKKEHLLSGNGQKTFDNILSFAKLPTHNYLVVSFHACRTVNMPQAFIDSAFEAFEQRLSDIIDSYMPDKIVCFGRRPFRVICEKQMNLVGDNHHYMIGNPVQKTLMYGKEKKKVDVTLSVPIDKMFGGDEGCLSLIGYIGENLKNAHAGKVRYALNRPDIHIVVIDTIKRFDKFFKMLINEPIAAIDTETDNLYKIKNRVLTIQFSFDEEQAFIIPLCHKDSPFDKDELQYIFDKLKYYFEFVKVKYMIFANPQFDLAIMKTQFRVRYYCSPIWCVFAGEKAFDENLKWIETVTGKYYYSLGNLACQYGDFSYLTGEFGKSDRVMISSLSLDTPGLLTYCGLDTVIPFAIHNKQLQRAKDAGYKKYVSVVTEQMSDIIHSLSTLEYNGYPVDIEYLFELKFPGSPINNEIDRLLSTFYACDSVQKLNAEILKAMGLPTTALFAKPTFAFKVNKKEHLERLFFDKLNLKPLKKGKSGKGKIDKAFQTTYIETEEVKLFADYKKAIKLRDSYVNQMAKFWSENEDFKSDRHVRCSFVHLTIVTGRVAAKRPGLQQIPSRSELGKHIKRLFAAPRNTFFVKVDYCVTGDALIPTENGLVRLDSFAAKGKNVDINVRMSCAGVNARAIKWTYVGKKETLKVVAESGNTVKCTPDHRLLVLRKGKLTWIQAQNCTTSDFLCMPKKPMVRQTNLPIALSEHTKINRNNTTGHTNIHLDVRYITYNVKIKNGNRYDCICGFKNLKDAIRARDNYYVKHGMSSANRSFKDLIKPQIMTTDLAYIIGCIVADGYIETNAKYNCVRFYNSDYAFIERFIKSIKNVFHYDATASIHSKKGSTKIINGVQTKLKSDNWIVRIRSNQMCQWLTELGIYSQYGKIDERSQSKNQVVPWSILQSDKQCQLAFLAAYLEADGSVNNESHRLSWSSSSDSIIEGIRAILNCLGYITFQSYNVTTCTIHLGVHSSHSLWSDIEPYMVTKALDYYEGKDKIGRIPYVYRNEYAETNVMLESLYNFTKVQSIEIGSIESVYDLTMEQGVEPAFVANGLLVHNCAHEVRGWGIISQDDAVAKAFKVGQNLRLKYKHGPTADLLVRIGLEGDVHKVNSSFFFNKKIEDVSKEDRNNIKGIIFGLIYGMLTSTLARTINREVEDTEKLVAKFMKQFVNGGSWFKKVHNFARKNLYVESPIGRRRNLYGYLFGDSDKNLHERVVSRYERQATNSVVQGFGSDCMMIGIRKFCTNVWNYSIENKYDPHIKPCVSVHDSLEVETDYKHLLLTINLIERSLTSDVKEEIKKRHGFELNSDLEIDFDLGVTTDKLSTWYGDLDELEAIVYKGMLYQNKIIRNKKHSKGKDKEEVEYSPKEIKRNMESVFNVEYMNDWMLHQAENHKPRFLDYKFDETALLERLGENV